MSMFSLGGTFFDVHLQGPRERAACKGTEAAAPSGPTFGTRLFVCAKNWVLRDSRSLNELEGSCTGCISEGRSAHLLTLLKLDMIPFIQKLPSLK